MVNMTVSNVIGGTYSVVSPPPGAVGTYTYGPHTGPNDIDFFYSPGGFISSGVQASSALVNGQYFQWSSFFSNPPAFSVLDDTHIRFFMNLGSPAFSTEQFYCQVILNNSTVVTSDQIYGVGTDPPFSVPALADSPPLVPTSGIQNTVITINGVGLSLLTKVHFPNATGDPTLGTLGTNVTVINDTQATVQVPALTSMGVGPLLLDTNFPTEPGSGQKVFTDTFFPQGAPLNITSFSPTTQNVGGTITILGHGFTGNTTLSIFFTGFTGGTQNISAPTFTIVDDNHITVTVPQGDTVLGTWIPIGTGPIKIVTTGPSGTFTSSASFTPISPTATITSFAPPSGYAGASVTITGTNLLSASGVSFNGIGTTFSYVDNSTLTAVAPNLLVQGAGPITVFSTNGGSSVSGSDLQPLFIGAGPITNVLNQQLNTFTNGGGPIFPDLLIDLPITRAAGPMFETFIDNSQIFATRAGGTMFNFLTDYPITQAGGNVLNFLADYPVTRTGGYATGFLTDYPVTIGGGPLADITVTNLVIISGEIIIGGLVRGEQVGGSTVSGEIVH